MCKKETAVGLKKIKKENRKQANNKAACPRHNTDGRQTGVRTKRCDGPKALLFVAGPGQDTRKDPAQTLSSVPRVSCVYGGKLCGR